MQSGSISLLIHNLETTSFPVELFEIETAIHVIKVGFSRRINAARFETVIIY